MEWKDQIWEYPRRYRLQQNANGSVELLPEKGQSIQEGTPVNAQNLNGMVQALKTHEAEIALQFAEVGYNIYQLYLQNYYDGKYPYKKGLFFDGFKNENVIDIENSNAGIDVSAGKIGDMTFITQDNKGNLEDLGFSYKDVAQTFTIFNDTNISSISVHLRKLGNPVGHVYCDIYNVENGKPSTVIAESNTHVPPSELTSSATKKEFEFDNVSLSQGTYAFVLRTGSTSSSNYYSVSRTSENSYLYGALVRRKSTIAWDEPMTYDLTFTIKGNLNIQNLTYQSQEQVFTQSINNAILYVKSKAAVGCSVFAEIAIYADTETFLPMTLESTRDLGDGYQEDKFTFATSAGNKVKVKLTLNRPDITTEFEVNEYGCILGVS